MSGWMPMGNLFFLPMAFVSFNQRSAGRRENLLFLNYCKPEAKAMEKQNEFPRRSIGRRGNML